MELPIVSALEFDQVKSSIKDFIKTKDNFKDYNFEGSNLSMLIDILAYNTLYTSYNVNMASNELNLDTAVLRDNVVSIAKRLGYRANSYTSSRVNVDITVNNTTQFDYVVLQRGSVLSANSNGKNYTFLLRNDVEVNTKGKSQAFFNDLELYEGSEFSISYTVDSSNEHQRFFVPNNYVDSETIRAFVIPDPSNNIEIEYEKKNTIVDVKNSDNVFFVEEVQDQKYEVIFGDDVIGRKVRNGEIIRIEYVVTAGSVANGIKNFKFNGKARGYTEQNPAGILFNLSDVTFTLNTDKSDGGSDYETIKSIKYRAPRYYASQERAVTLSDYESIIQQIYPNAELVNVVGGETLSPPQYGKVFITIKPFVGEYVSDYEKQRIIKELDKYKVGSVDVRVLDPNYMNIVIKPIIIYDQDKTKNRASELTSLVNEVVGEYVTQDDFNRFGGLYSDLDLRCKIKDIDNAIKFVKIPIYLRQQVDLIGGLEKKYDVNFHTSLKTDSFDKYYLISDPFCHRNISTPVYIAAPTDCNSDGIIYLYNIYGRPLKEVGNVDIKTGKVNFIVQSCDDDPINITVIPDIIDFETGPGTIPSITLLPPSINEDDDDTIDILNPDVPVIDVPNIISDPPPGDPIPLDPTVLTPVISSPGGGIPAPGFGNIIEGGGEGDTGGDGDGDNYDTIDNYIPEIDPYSCS